MPPRTAGGSQIGERLTSIERGLDVLKLKVIELERKSASEHGMTPDMQVGFAGEMGLAITAIKGYVKDASRLIN